MSITRDWMHGYLWGTLVGMAAGMLLALGLIVSVAQRLS